MRDWANNWRAGRRQEGRSSPQQQESEDMVLVFSASDVLIASRGGAAEIVARVWIKGLMDA